MPNHNDHIRGIIGGNPYEICRIVNDVPAGMVPTDAWLTLRSSLHDAGDVEPLFEIHITPANVAGVGQIELSATEPPNLRFDLSGLQTAMIVGQDRFWQIAVKLDNIDDPYTPFAGRISASAALRRI